MKTIAVGQIRDIICASCPAPEMIRRIGRPSSAALCSTVAISVSVKGVAGKRARSRKAISMPCRAAISAQ